MNAPLSTSVSEDTADLKSQYHALLQQEPSVRIRNAAQRLGVSELALLETRLGVDVTRLHAEPRAILQCIHTLGDVMALTRNDAVVHERHGRYDNMRFFQQGKMNTGLALNPDIDLRLFMNHWAHCLAVTDAGTRGERHSLQFFDRSGMAIHKIYLTEHSDLEALARLKQVFTAVDQTPTAEFEAPAAREFDLDDNELDSKGLEQAWRDLQDTHDFFLMLKRFKAGRQQALRVVSDDLAHNVGIDAVRKVLEMARDRQCEIMVFVGNPGCIQIHTGPVVKLLPRDNWFNVLDPQFNLHIDMDRVGSSWVTRKPTVDGTVTALEVFDTDGELIVSLFGKRKPGLPELQTWREIIADLEAGQ